MHLSTKHTKPRKGFTLFEVILATAIIAILIGSVFSISASSISLSESIVKAQDEQRHHTALNNYFYELFSNLPYESKVIVDTNEDNLPRLTIEHPGSYFPSFAKDEYASLFQVSLIKDRNGNFSLLSLWSSSNTPNDENTSPQQIRLVKNLSLLTWSLYSKQDHTWHPDWSSSQPRPTHIKLRYQLVNDTTPRELMFWIPPRAKAR